MKTEPARPSTAAGRSFAPSPPSAANPSPGAQVREACALLQRMFDAAIAAAQPQLCLPPFLPNRDQLGTGKLIVIGAGKASAAMAQALEAHYRQTDPDFVALLNRLRYNQPTQADVERLNRHFKPNFTPIIPRPTLH